MLLNEEKLFHHHISQHDLYMAQHHYPYMDTNHICTMSTSCLAVSGLQPWKAKSGSLPNTTSSQAARQVCISKATRVPFLDDFVALNIIIATILVFSNILQFAFLAFFFARMLLQKCTGTCLLASYANET